MSKKILIVEDEVALADVLSAKFTKEGFETRKAADGEDGLEQIEAWRPDLILLDIVMPKVDGYQVLETLQKNNDKTPVIVISNSGQDVELEKIKQLGAVDSVVKTQMNPAEVVEKARKVLNLPSGEAAKAAPAVSFKETKDEEGGGDGPKVLLVEDDPFLRDICFKKLRKEGFNVLAAINGEEALEKIGKFEPRIVLLDIILPAMDGFDVLKNIRAHVNVAVKDIPVVMLTNLGQEDDIKKAMSLGATDYLVKAHFTTEEIVAKVKSQLGL